MEKDDKPKKSAEIALLENVAADRQTHSPNADPATCPKCGTRGETTIIMWGIRYDCCGYKRDLRRSLNKENND